MKKWYIFTTVLLTSCLDCDYDLSIPNTYRSFLHNYTIGDTIYFESNRNDVDTMLIMSYDTLENCAGVMVAPRKLLEYKIRHLPKNNWSAGAELDQNGNKTILNQKLVVIEKDVTSKDSFWLYVHYRDFGGEVVDFNNKVHDSVFQDLGVSEYWVISKSNYYRDSVIPRNLIHKVYWSESYGLTGYKYGNGEMYRIKK